MSLPLWFQALLKYFTPNGIQIRGIITDKYCRFVPSAACRSDSYTHRSATTLEPLTGGVMSSTVAAVQCSSGNPGIHVDALSSQSRSSGCQAWVEAHIVLLGGRCLQGVLVCLFCRSVWVEAELSRLSSTWLSGFRVSQQDTGLQPDRYSSVVLMLWLMGFLISCPIRALRSASIDSKYSTGEWLKELLFGLEFTSHSKTHKKLLRTEMTTRQKTPVHFTKHFPG